jgi:uncharacterized protein (TIGR02145 family)
MTRPTPKSPSKRGIEKQKFKYKKMKQFLLSTLMILCAAAHSQTIIRIHQSNGTVIQIPISTIDSITYFNGNPGNQATLTTLAIGNITATGATSGGSITNDGGTPITQRGICWATTQNPTTANNTAVAGTGTGSFTANLTGLTANTTYYVRAYAINTAGTAYGNQLSFTTSSGSSSTGDPFNPNLTYGSVTDQDNNTYKTIQIGTQTWMAENLRTTRYRNGTAIPNITDNTQWQNNTTGAWSYYNNDANNNVPYGKLYNWYAVNNTNQLCPTDWHVPSDAEWTTLINFLDSNADGGNNSNTAGGKMKSIGTQYWFSPNTSATNSCGWSGLAGGGRYYNGIFLYVGSDGFWWSSTQSSTLYAWYRTLYYSLGGIDRDYYAKAYGVSVRCVKD